MAASPALRSLWASAERAHRSALRELLLNCPAAGTGQLAPSDAAAVAAIDLSDTRPRFAHALHARCARSLGVAGAAAGWKQSPSRFAAGCRTPTRPRASAPPSTAAGAASPICSRLRSTVPPFAPGKVTLQDGAAVTSQPTRPATSMVYEVEVIDPVSRSPIASKARTCNRAEG